MSAEAFFDTNILLYAVSGDAFKAQRSNEVLLAGGIISTQVLNEFANVARRKNGRAWGEIKLALGYFRSTLRVESLDETTHERGIELAERYGFAMYDALIVASAEIAGCSVLYTEDMHDGLVIGSLTIRNPYA